MRSVAKPCTQRLISTNHGEESLAYPAKSRHGPNRSPSLRCCSCPFHASHLLVAELLSNPPGEGAGSFGLHSAHDLSQVPGEKVTLRLSVAAKHSAKWPGFWQEALLTDRNAKIADTICKRRHTNTRFSRDRLCDQCEKASLQGYWQELFKCYGVRVRSGKIL